MGLEPFKALVSSTKELGDVLIAHLLGAAEALGSDRRATVAASIGKMHGRDAQILADGTVTIERAVGGIKKAGRSAEEKNEHDAADSILSA